jgi:pimeloyl-ACP methyl ester carboxylesterase
MADIRVAGRRLEFARIDQATRDPATIVLLHDGLGSISAWKDFPEALHSATGHEVLVYSRYGYGGSQALSGPRSVQYMHEEALIALPALLDQLGVANPILIGHSDGASIAIIHAGGTDRPVAGLILLAPHVFVEDVCIASIAAAERSYATTGPRMRLARHHADPDSAFRGWSDIWLSPEFSTWNIEQYLPGIDCTVFAIQGEDDEYGTMQQVERIARAASSVEVLQLENCGHSPHRDQPARVLQAIGQFVASLDAAPPQRRSRNNETCGTPGCCL